MGHLLYHRPPAEVGPFPKLERALLSISQISMDSGGSMTHCHGLRAGTALGFFLEARAHNISNLMLLALEDGGSVKVVINS